MRKRIMATIGLLPVAVAILTGCLSNQGFDTIPSQFTIDVADEDTGEKRLVADNNCYGRIKESGQDDFRL